MDWPRNTAPWKHTLVLAAVCAAAFFLFPESLSLLTRMAVTAILVLSLDLVVGYAGLATLGHGVFFGVGAYVTANVALRLIDDPLLGLAFGAAAGAVVAGVSALLILRYQGFTFLMLTVALAQLVQSLAGKVTSLTGGDDGLSGFTMAPLLGARFDITGRTSYVYAACVLIVMYWVAKRVVDSPFGLSIQGIRQSRDRMAALGTPIPRQLWTIYTIAGAMAGVAGALSAQTNGIVGLDSLGFELSAEILVMLILGGAGRLFGAVVGSALFVVLHHTASSIDPYHWLFVIGGTLMVVVLFPHSSVRALFERSRRNATSVSAK